MSKRNMTAQRIVQKDGTVKVIHHEKKMNGAQYGSHSDWWKAINTNPKPNSKRQKLLNEDKIVL